MTGVQTCALPICSLTFLPGQTTKTINVLVTGDEKVELDEVFDVLLSGLGSNGRDVIFTDATGQGTIENDDQAIVNIAGVSQVETHSGQTAFVFTVSMTTNSDATTTIDFATSDGSATTADNDYDANSGTLTFLPGVVTQTFTVYVNGDTKVELDEYFNITLDNLTVDGRNIVTGTITTTGNIQNDDEASITINNVSQVETHSGTTAFVFTVTMSTTSDANVTVDYATADGTALITDSDYQSTGGTLTFLPGEVTQTVTVTVNGDIKVEVDETFTVNLSNLQNNGRDISITDASGLATIENDDIAYISINNVTHPEPDAGYTKEYVFTVTHSGSTIDSPFTVAFTTNDGTATVSGGDYDAETGTLTFSGTTGETHTIIVTVNGDDIVEPTEIFTVDLSEGDFDGRNIVFSDNQGVGTITDNESALVSILATQPNAGEPSTDGQFTVYLSFPSSTPTVISYIVGGTATAGGDYTTLTGTVTIPEIGRAHV